MVMVMDKCWMIGNWITGRFSHRPGIEPGSTAWKAAMLTIIPPTLYSSSDDVSCGIKMIKFRVVVFLLLWLLTFSPLEDSALRQTRAQLPAFH